MHHASTDMKNHIAPKQDHIQIYKQEHMANSVLIMSIAITRNRVLGFKNQPYEGFGCLPIRSNSLTNSSNDVFLKILSTPLD